MRITAARFAALFVLLISLFATPSLAVTPANFWTVLGETDATGTVTSMAIVPSNGDIVATGYFHNTLSFGNLHLAADNSQNGTEIFVARLSRAGEVKWARRFGSAANEQGNCIAVDASGNIILVGQFDGSFDMGGGYLFSNGARDMFMAKLDPIGARIWAYEYGGALNDAATSVAVDASGNLFVGGFFSQSLTLGGGITSAAGGIDAFLAKYDTNGAWQWNRTFNGPGDEYVSSVATDGSNAYVTGPFNSSLTVGGFPVLNTAGANDIFLSKVDAVATIQWVKQFGGTGDEIPSGLASDASGNLALTGAFQNSVNFGGSTLVSAGGYDGFLARYNSTGAHQWSLRFGTTTDSELGYGVAMNSSSKVFVAGASGADLGGAPGAGHRDIVFGKYSSTGVLAWTRAVGSQFDDVAISIAVDAGDNIAVGGAAGGPTNFGTGVMWGNGGGGLFLARYGVAEPAITTIKDVSNDQGKQVRITFARSPLDDGSASQQQVTEYQAFRRVLPLPSASSLRGPQAVPAGSWEYVGSVPASNQSTYRMVAPTLADSTKALGMYRTKFYVRAATDNASLFYDSPADSGYSLDNLAPGVPSNFAYISGNLSWNKSAASDFDYFTVYGSNSNSFGSATLINYTVSPAMDVSGTHYSYYFVTATDFSGNEGKSARVNKTTGVGDTPLPHVLSVSAYPNPFNPETTVRYTVPARGHVELDVYDMRGERVAMLVNGDEEAGAYTVAWQGLNDAGRHVGSGVYFARLSENGSERTYKLTLLK